MVDNVPITPGAGANIATDDIGGTQYQRIKVTWGVDGTATDVSAAAPLPMQERGYQGAEALTVGAADATPRRAVLFNVTVAGNIVFKFADDSTLTQAVSVGGPYILPFAVKGIVTSGTTATATYANLI